MYPSAKVATFCGKAFLATFCGMATFLAVTLTTSSAAGYLMSLAPPEYLITVTKRAKVCVSGRGNIIRRTREKKTVANSVKCSSMYDYVRCTGSR